MKATRAALLVFEKDEAKREAAWDAIATDADVTACQKADAEALEPVRLAFFEDTKAYNSWNHVKGLGIAFMRRVAKGAK